VLAFASVTAWAIPSLINACDSGVCVTWTAAQGPFDPNVDAHQHRDAFNLLNVPGWYKTYSAWDDFLYRYNAVADRPLTRAQDGQDFGHGHMALPALYSFDATVPAWAIPLIGKVETYWETKVNQTGQLNVFGVPTSTRIDFQQGGPNVIIRFAPNFPVKNAQGDVVNRDFPQDSDIDPFGNWPSSGQPPSGGAPWGGRDGALAYWTPSLHTLTFNSNVNWYQDIALPDIDLSLADNNAAFGIGMFDFVTTALHEWGHVLGLDHPDQALVGTTMFDTQARRGARDASGALDATAVVNRIDAFTLEGAKNLYTAAFVPEPSSGGLMLFGLAMLASVAVRRRRSSEQGRPRAARRKGSHDYGVHTFAALEVASTLADLRIKRSLDDPFATSSIPRH